MPKAHIFLETYENTLILLAFDIRKADMVIHAYKPNTLRDWGRGIAVTFRPAWAMERAS